MKKQPIGPPVIILAPIYLGISGVTILTAAATISVNTFTMTTCPAGLYVAPWTTPYNKKLCSIKCGNQRSQVIKPHHLPTSTCWEELNFLGLEEERVQILEQDGPPPYQTTLFILTQHIILVHTVSPQLDFVHCLITYILQRGSVSMLR